MIGHSANAPNRSSRPSGNIQKRYISKETPGNMIRDRVRILYLLFPCSGLNCTADREKSEFTDTLDAFQIMIIWIQITQIFNTNGTQWRKSFIYRGQSQALAQNIYHFV